MSKCKHKDCKCRRKLCDKIGIIVASIGLGIVITVFIPVWGFVIVVGAGLIGAGWYLINKC